MNGISTIKHYVREENIHYLIRDLKSKNDNVRQRAHKELLWIGDDAIQPLLALMHDPDPCMASEAALILGGMSSPEGPHTLALALEHGNPLVRWNATQALIHFGRGGVVAVLEVLAEGCCSERLFLSAHDILNTVAQNQYLTREEEKVLANLHEVCPNPELTQNARNALESLRDCRE